MKLLRYLLTAIFLSFFLLVSIGYPYQTKEGKAPLTSEERKIIHNQYGAIIQDAQGKRINYSWEQLEVQSSLSSQSLKILEPSSRSIKKIVTDSEPLWSYGAFGSCIGVSNIIVAPLGDHLEMYLGGSYSTFGSNNYWHALYYNAAIGKYEQTYVSTYFPEGIKCIKVADVIGDSNNEIVVALEDGRIQFYDQATKAWLVEVITAADGLSDMEIADVDNDGQNELILCTSNYPNYDHLYVYSASGVLEWDMDNAGGSDAVVGQMDDDSALEIAVTNGYVIDTAAREVQWHWTNGFGAMLEVGDIDNDNRDELIAAERWYIIWAYDVERQLPRWSIPIDLDIGAIYLTDIDEDSVSELLVGEGQWGAILAYDTVTQSQEWSVNNPEHGVTNIAVGDVDGDGVTELMWGAGATSTGEDHLYVTNWQTQQIEWQNIHLDGPFVGPETGDLDGDGDREIVAVSWESDSGYGSGRILVFDSNHHVRAISDEIVAGYAWTGTHDLQLYDVDQDGKQEILVAADRLYDGVIEIYDFNADNTFTLIWTNSTRPEGAPFYSVTAGDIDGDSQLEIVGGVGREHTGALGTYIYVYDYNTGSEEWHSLQMGYDYWNSINYVEISDLDSDGFQEIIGLVNQEAVYIFNGTTKVLDTIIFDPHTALAILNFDQTGPLMALGDANGNIKFYTYIDGSYQVTFDHNYGTGLIDGVSSNSTTEKQIFGSSGTLNIATPNEIIWTSPCYGSLFGKHPAFLSNIPAIYSAGSYSIAGFAYLPSITVTSPNGGEDWQEGTTQSITWYTDGISGKLELTLWKDGASVGKIADGIESSPGSYTWTVGQYIGGTAPPGTGYTVKVQEIGTVYSDMSDSSFTISGTILPSITVISPNGGETWQASSSHAITWTSSNLTGNVNIDLYKGGVYHSYIGTTTVGAGSRQWDIPPDIPAGNDYRVRIHQESIEDYSDGDFSLIYLHPFRSSPDFNGDGYADVQWRYYGTGGYNAIWLIGTGGTGGTAAVTSLSHSNRDKIKPGFMNLARQRKSSQKDVWESFETQEIVVIKDGFAGLKNGDRNSFALPHLSRVMAASVSDPRDDPQSVDLLAVEDLDWELSGTGDFNFDGKIDIVWSHSGDGRNCVWYMDGVTLSGYEPFPEGSNPDWKLSGVEDFNLDGKPDLLWRNEVDGRNAVWYMDGTTLLNIGIMTAGANLDWKLCGTGDFNNDGKADLVWRNLVDGRNAVWYMDGAELVSVGFLDPVENLNWKLRGTGDFNNDGKTDLIWTYATDGRNCIWYLDGVILTGVEFLTTVTNTDWKIEN